MAIGEVSTTVTLAGGERSTVINAAPVFPSLAANTVAVPTETADTNPFDEMVATLGLSIDHVTDRVGRTLLAASRGDATPCVMLPIEMFVESKAMVTLATAGGPDTVI